MERKINFNLLKSNYFLVSLFLLILNDLYLKYEFSNWFTGKLSDFAGLFIFPFFFSVFIPSKIKQIYFSTVLLFVFWKLEISNTFINYITELTNIAFYRTIDNTDFIALVVLPFSYKYFLKQKTEIKNEKTTKYLINPIIGIITIYAFIADTNPRQNAKVKFKSNQNFVVELNKNDILANSQFKYQNPNISEIDSLFDIYFDIPTYRAEATAKVRIIKIEKDKTIIKLDSITEVLITGTLFFGISQSNINGCEKLNVEEYEKYFEENCIEVIKQNKKIENSSCYLAKSDN